MSMISKLIEELIDNADLYTKELHDLMYIAADTIEMLSEKAREPKQEWIPVSEALPSEGQVVLAIGDKGTWDVGKFQGTAGWTDDERIWRWKKKTFKRVEYWMPKDVIPLPNREDGEA